MKEKKLTICFFGEADPQEVHSLKWAKFFAERGHNVHFFSYSLPGDNPPENIKIHVIKKRFPNAGRLLNTLVNLPISVVKTRRTIRKIKPDVVHGLCVTSYGTITSFLGFRPLMVTAYGSDILINPHNSFITKLTTKYVLRKADILTTDANHMKKAMVELGADPRKIKIINFGIDTKRFSPGSKDHEIEKELGLSGHKAVISLKWMNPLSDIETLVRAAPLVLNKISNVKFVLVGPGSQLESLKNLAKKLGVKDNIIFAGWIPNEKLPRYLRTADVFVSTAVSDAGLASSTGEAMSAGLPVIVTNFGENKDWVKDGKNGFLIPLRNPKILAEKIVFLLRESDLRKDFGKRGREKIEEKNNYYKEMGKMENIYRGYQICTKCIMDTSDPDITFDEDGVCNYCRDYKKILRYLGTEEDLKKKVEKIKESGKGKKYDCLIALSGGVDSCMAAYVAKNMGLRPLAIHLDNCWDSEIAQANIEKVVRKLGIDLYTHVIDWEEFRDLQLSFLKASVSNIDYPNDHAIFALFYNKAAEEGVKYIIHGSNVKTENLMPSKWGYISWDLKHLRAVHKKFGNIKKLKTYPKISLWRLVYYSLVKKIERFPIIDYIDYNKKRTKEFLEKEFGWEDYGGKHCESLYTRFFVGYMLPRKFGFDRNRAWLSNLIHSGQMTREQALEKLPRATFLNEKAMEDNKKYVVKKLGITEKYLDEIIALPVRDHKDYPNNSLFYERLVFVYSFIKRLIVK